MGMKRWWRGNGALLAGTAAGIAAAVLMTGWFTGLRAVMHGALLTVAVVALLPVVIICGGLLLVLLAALLAALLAGEDAGSSDVAGGVVEAGGWLLPRYYGFLARQRHPVFWGVPLGALLGGLLLWAALALAVVPKETQTVSTLLVAKLGAEAAYKQHKRFPKPDDQRRLPCAAVQMQGHEACTGGVVIDGFGRPLSYEVKGRWRLATFRVTSLGFDGEPGRDDLCVGGSTRLAKIANAASGLLAKIAGKDPEGVSLTSKLLGVKELRCEEGSE